MKKFKRIIKTVSKWLVFVCETQCLLISLIFTGMDTIFYGMSKLFLKLFNKLSDLLHKVGD